jgi:glycerol kinase
MSSNAVILTLDQGTTSTRCLAINAAGAIVATAQKELPQHYPEPGWVEHDAQDIWRDSLTCLQQVVEKLRNTYSPIALGITNQRETTIIWDRQTGQPIHKAIVWQDRRTASTCNSLSRDGHESMVTDKTGLLLDPYFSATKISWILDHVDGARAKAETGELAFGTVESWLVWKLTNGAVHVSDETNAARTSLYNIHSGTWDETLLQLFNVPRAILPDVVPSAGQVGETNRDITGVQLPITGLAGDQQSAAFGQLCLKPGMLKSTYGTGCFALMNTGSEAKRSAHKLLTTRACRIGADPQFALEGSIFMAGAISQWLRDEMGLVASAAETEMVAQSIADSGGVYLVPAFAGLGAPYWDSEARAAIFGMTRNTGQAELVRAALEAVAYQTQDLMQAFAADGGAPAVIRVDGGMAANSWLMQTISNVTQTRLERPANLETTALGAAFLAGLSVGLWPDTDALAGLGGMMTGFEPIADGAWRTEGLKGWSAAVEATRLYASRLD